MKKKSCVLDSFALLAYFQAESGGSKVKEVLKESLFAKTAVYMSIISLAEVLCITERKFGKWWTFHGSEKEFTWTLPRCVRDVLLSFCR